MSTFKNSDGAVRFGRNDYARLSSMSLPFQGFCGSCVEQASVVPWLVRLACVSEVMMLAFFMEQLLTRK